MSTIMQKTAATKVNPPRFNNQYAAAAIHNVAAVDKNQQKIEFINTKANNMTALSITSKQEISTQSFFSQTHKDIIRNTICKDLSQDEFDVFLLVCNKTQLDPIIKQIHPVKRRSKRPDGSWGHTMTIQTGIDGYRLIAERTGKYSPGQKPTFEYDQNGKLISATAYVKKLTADGTWHIVEAEAYFDEYVQTFNDKNTGEKKLNDFWASKSRIMLAKCAEALALRRAFPAELSGIYTKEEMMQADNVEIQEIIPRINFDQAKELDMILGDCSPEYRTWVFEFLKKKHNVDNIYNLPLDLFDRVKSAALKNMEETVAKQRQESSEIEVAESVQ